MVRYIRRWGVEPTMFLYMMGYMLTSVVEEDLIVYKSCLATHGYPHEICINISQPQYQLEKQIIQVTASWFHMWENIASHAVPAVLALFLGSWSDRVGRKIPLLMGLCGGLIYSVALLFNSFVDSWRIEWILLTGALPCGLTGGPLAVFMAAFSYLADTTSAKDRTFRTTLLEVSYLITMPTGVALGSFLFNKVFDRSHGAMFALNCTCLLLSIIYTWFALEWKTCQTVERKKISLPQHKHENEVTHETLIKQRCGESANSGEKVLNSCIDGSIEVKIENGSNCTLEKRTEAIDLNVVNICHNSNNKARSVQKCHIIILSFVKFVGSHVSDSIRTLTKSRSKNRRVLLYLCLVSLALYTFQREEKHSIYLYTQLRFHWDLATFSAFRTVQSVLYIVGLLVGVPLLNRILNIRDTVIMMIGAISHIAARVTFSLANRKSLFYLGGGLGMLGPIVGPVIRSSVSKLVPSNERGKVFALLSVSDMAVPLVSGALYSLIYSQSLIVFPQAVFLLTIVSQIIVFITAVWMECLLKGQPITQCTEVYGSVPCEETGKQSELSISASVST